MLNRQDRRADLGLPEPSALEPLGDLRRGVDRRPAERLEPRDQDDRSHQNNVRYRSISHWETVLGYLTHSCRLTLANSAASSGPSAPWMTGSASNASTA